MIDLPLQASSHTFSTRRNDQTAGHALSLWSMMALVVLAPLIRGGNRHIALAVLECLALVVLLSMAWYAMSSALRTSVRPVSVAWIVLVTAPAWLVGWHWMPALLGQTDGPGLPTTSLGSALVGLPLFASLLAGRYFSDQAIGVLARIFLLSALLQTGWGLLQVAGLDGLRFGQTSGGAAIGSFANRNTYSNYLVMALPWVVWRIAAHRHPARSPGRHRMATPVALAPQGWAWLAGLLLMLSLLFLARSRTGIVTGLLVLLLALPLLLGWRSGRHDTARPLGRRWLLAGAAALLGLALLATGWEWLARFDADHLMASDASRALLRQTTWQAALAHWPWGTGLGSYASAYPAWQPAEFGRHLIDLAHNDYLQLFMELGLAFVPLASAVLWLLGRQLWRLWRQPAPHGRTAHNRRQLQVAAGLGLLATALHAWVDYPFHIPANAMMGCFLLGVFLRPVE